MIYSPEPGKGRRGTSKIQGGLNVLPFALIWLVHNHPERGTLKSK